VRVLIIEDNPVGLEALETYLRHEGMEVQGAANGLGALTRLEVFSPDVLVLDLLMPGLDGLAFLQHLRADPRWKDLPVVINTGAGGAVLEKVLAMKDALAPLEVLPKPADPAGLLALLKSLGGEKS
jgi:phosphoserine phosphatase RsbU/P